MTEEEGLFGISFQKYFDTKGFWKKQKLLKGLKYKESVQFLKAFDEWSSQKLQEREQDRKQAEEWKRAELEEGKRKGSEKSFFQRLGNLTQSNCEIKKELSEGDSLRDALFQEYFNTKRIEGTSPLTDRLKFGERGDFMMAFDKWRRENKGKERYRLERYVADVNKAVEDWRALVRAEKTTIAEKFFDSLIEGEQFNLRRLMAQSGLSGEDAYEFVRNLLSKRKIRIITVTGMVGVFPFTVGGPTEIYEKTRKEEWLEE